MAHSVSKRLDGSEAEDEARKAAARLAGGGFLLDLPNLL
jgi:hypothetical protein